VATPTEPPTPKPATPLTGLTRAELVASLAAAGQPGYRADQVLDWVYRKGAESYGAMTNLGVALRDSLARSHPITGLDFVRQTGSRDTTRKFLFRLRDGRYVESVLIPASPALYGSRSDRRTACVSSQVGCAYGCVFCASGLAGSTRNLDASEIVAQVLELARRSGERVDNIVFMGMGEPLANLGNLTRAIEILNAPWGAGIGARHITVSTSGLAPQIVKLAGSPYQIRLAVSLHGATDEVRDRIMPVNRKFPLDTLFDALRAWREKKKQRVTFEYILIDGVNDSPADAEALARRAGSVAAKVNLIPYNTVEGLPWRRPPEARQQEFLGTLARHGTAATLRREKGHDIDAACGQLRLRQEGDESAAG
jgi:23S rRNA (adenine2503-C2)-methyltransferase